MKFHRTVLASALAGITLLCGTSTALAGVPVIDGALNTLITTLDTKNTMQQAKDWVDTGIHWKTQYDWYMKQITNLKSGNYAGLLQEVAGTYFTQGGAMSGLVFGQYGDGDDAAKKYLGEANACKTGVEGEENTTNYKACNAARNMQAKALQDMEKMLEQAQTRTDEIQKLVASSRTSGVDAGVLQQKAIEMMGLQAMLQNDLAKLQLTIEMHKQRQILYKQEQQDQAQAVMRGNGKALSLDTVLNGLN